VNIRDVAREARVSHSTVSRVINNVSTVDPKLVRRIRAVIDQMGYRPNHQAQSLARGHSNTVGLLVSELSGGNPFFSEIILYFERAAVAHGFEVLICFADTETDPNHVAVCAHRMMERQVEGIAVLTFGIEQSLDSKAEGRRPHANGNSQYSHQLPDWDARSGQASRRFWASPYWLSQWSVEGE
jgi:LacI family transcriptional regulator